MAPRVLCCIQTSNMNKSNSAARPRESRGKSAGDVRCQLNLYSKSMSRKCLTLKISVKFMEYNIYIGAIRLRMLPLQKSHDALFATGLTIHDILICHLECLGQDHEV